MRALRGTTAPLAVLAVAALGSMSIGVWASEIVGPFQSCQRTNQMSSEHFYIYNASGEPFTIRVRCLEMQETGSDWAAFPRLMVRVLDVDERRIFRGQLTCEEWAAQEALPHEAVVNVERSTPGVVQVVVTGGRTPSSTFDVATDPPLPLGIMGSIKVIVPPQSGIEEGYVYIPPGARELHLEPVDADVTVWDENGAEVLHNEAGTLAVGRTEVVWRIAVRPHRWPGAKVFTDGFPVIVCGDEQTARAIRGSVEELADGTIVAHKLQVRLDRLLRETFGSPDDLAVEPVDSFEPMTDAFLSDPYRYRHLLVEYSPPLPFVNLWLDRQVLDSASPWFGGIHAPADYGDALTPYTIPGSPLNPREPAPVVPAATNEKEHDVWTGFSPWGYAAGMAFLYDLDERVNPWWHDRRLLGRVIIAACRDLMLLNESELIQGRPGDWMGSLAFIFRYQIADPYGYVGQAVKETYPEIHREWTEGMTRLADRLAYMSVFAPANQAAHIPYGLWRVHQGSGDEFYAEMTRYTAQRLCDCLQKPAGYSVEGYGPCSSYNGITLDLFAMLYIETGDPFYRESVRRTSHCFNHTVAPEPSGQMIGVTDLNHRVQNPWTLAQHGGGKRLMAPYIQEAGVWFREAPPPDEQARLAEAMRERAAETPWPVTRCGEIIERGVRYGSGSARRYFLHHNPEVMAGGLFPYEEPSFFRNLGDEFICVRRPAYYALVYVGKPGSPQWLRPFPPTKSAVRTGGGISLLWTPDYRVALAGQGWNAYCHHGLIVDMGEDVVRTADYYAVEFNVAADAGKLNVRGQIEELPLEYSYGYQFADDRILIETLVTATGDLDAQSCHLQFPLFASKERGLHCDIPGGPTRTVLTADDQGAGVEFRFAEPVSVELGETSTKQISPIEYVIEQLRVALPARWEADDRVLLRYEIVPFPAGGE